MKEKAEDHGLTDLTDLTEETAEEASDSELFAHLARREPRHASGLHRRLPAGRAEIAQLGALLPSSVGKASIPAKAARSAPPPFDDDDALTPARQSLPQPRSAAEGRKGVVFTSAVGAAVLTLVVVIVLVAGRGAGTATGSLLVTVTGEGSRAVTGFEVRVDGAKRCVESPCRITAIEAGTHLVDVRGPGFEPTASLAVSVPRGAESVLNVTLSPIAKSPPVAAPVASAPAVAAAPVAVAVASPPAAQKAVASPIAQKRGDPTPAATASASGAAAAEGEAAFGTLRIVSLPVASVLVDGRPVGQTPRVVRVAPGAHRVAIVDGEQRRAQTVTVAPGATQVVSVRF